MSRSHDDQQESPQIVSGRRVVCCRCLSLTALSLVGLLNLSGCGYTIGNQTPRGVRTIYVPVFTSDATRQGIEYQLTEAVQNQIKLRTHYRLASAHNAETILKGHVVELRKSVLGETANDDPRELQFGLALNLVWVDARTDRVLAEHSVQLSGQGNFHEMETFADIAPEVGQSLATGYQTLVDRAAKQAVEILEVPW